jgi:hypothetical protein
MVGKGDMKERRTNKEAEGMRGVRPEGWKKGGWKGRTTDGGKGGYVEGTKGGDEGGPYHHLQGGKLVCFDDHMRPVLVPLFDSFVGQAVDIVVPVRELRGL